MKLRRQIGQFGAAVKGMPPLEVSRVRRWGICY